MTGDNHIGLRYASHEQAQLLVRLRLEAFQDMVEKANEEMCDLFVITGDLFENTYSIAKKDVVFLLDMLSRFHGIVAVLPGNHDYYDADTKLWQYFSAELQNRDNILLLSQYRSYPLEIDGKSVILYPALCTSLHSAPGQNNLGWIKQEKIEADEVFRIGIAHGAVQGETIDNEGQYFLMTREELEEIPMDAWLIGHTHVPFPRNLMETEFTAGERIFNAGTHVQTDVSCNTEGQCFILEIENAAGIKPVKAKKFVSGNIRFYRKEILATAGELEECLKRETADFEDQSVVDLIINGAALEEEYSSRYEIIEQILSRFVEGTYDDHKLSKLITEDLICAEFPETSFSAGFLRALMTEPKEAQLVYDLLQEMREEK